MITKNFKNAGQEPNFVSTPNLELYIEFLGNIALFAFWGTFHIFCASLLQSLALLISVL